MTRHERVTTHKRVGIKVFNKIVGLLMEGSGSVEINTDLDPGGPLRPKIF
jgi:hypothetical protein